MVSVTTAALSAGALALLGIQAPGAQAVPASPAAAGSTTTHPGVVASCAQPKPGEFGCFALRRTDVPATKGLTAATLTPSGYGAGDLRGAYGLPADGGAGQTIAIVDAFDDPNAEQDLAVYRAQYGLPACTTANGCFTKVSQRGGTDLPAADTNWAGEISLDLDMVSAAAPNAHILLVEGDSAGFADLGASVNEAVALGAKYVSNSYGSSYTPTPGSGEDPAETTQLDAYYNHPGVAVVVSSGDSAYGVSYPASSQYVTSVGGTALVRDAGTARGWSESVWHSANGGTGSGCSVYEPKPAFQTSPDCAMRSVADVSAVADPATGVSVYQTYGGGGWAVYGGTSASAPIITGAYASAGTPSPGTYPNSYPYLTQGAGLNDVTTGSNGTCSPASLCTAGVGYDGPTGLGTPNGLVAFRNGPHGTISGKVTDASTGAPIPGAAVAVGNGSTHTGADGSYSVAVAAGTYDITVSAYGYATGSATGVQLADGNSLTKSFALAPVPSRRVSGKVTDGSGHGWPLYAKITIDGVPGGPVWTDPYTGAYHVNLPQNHDYTLHVTSAYPGYQPATVPVRLGGSDTRRDIAVPADPFSGTTPGYTPTDTGTTETFDSTAAAPSGWTVTDAAGTVGGWEFDDPSARGNTTGGSGAFAIADSDHAGKGAHQDSSLISPVYDFSADTTPELSFQTDYLAYQLQKATIDASTDGGATWSNVWSANSAITGPSKITVPLTAFAHDANVRIRFHFTSSFGWYWSVDNVFVGNRTLPATPGGLVAGRVTDANTGHPLNAAQVTGASGSGLAAATNATPDDATVNGGFYWLFAPTGKHTLTAAKRPYAPLPRDVNVRVHEDGITKLMFPLDAGQLTVTPTSLSASVSQGSHTTRTLTVKNTGGAPATLTLSERPGGFSTNAQGAPLSTTTGDFSPLAIQPPAAGPSSAASTPPAASPASGTAWQTSPNLPEGLQDNAVDVHNGKVYNEFGTDIFNRLSKLYVFSPETGAWTRLADARNIREAPVHGFIGDKLYAAGGWSNFGAPSANLEIYDPATNTWAFGARNTRLLAASGSAVLNGKLYAVGGCGPNYCGSTSVLVYDPASDSWSTAADYPESTAWTSCGAILGKLYCAGGATDSTTSKSAYVYDPSSDSWTPLPDLPQTDWGSASAVANGQLTLSSGIIGGRLSNQAFAYDPALDAWTTLPNVNQATYRGGGATGLYKVGGSTGDTFPVATVERLPGYDQPDSADVTWLSEPTQQLTLQPGKSVKLTVTLNAAVPEVNQAGTYTAQLVFNTNTPYRVHGVPVSLTVAPPKK
jgi:N-acetylneuraminic acid mutarotase